MESCRSENISDKVNEYNINRINSLRLNQKSTVENLHKSSKGSKTGWYQISTVQYESLRITCFYNTIPVSVLRKFGNS